MKRFILIAAAMLGLAIAATAQPRAIGGKMGSRFEASYQHTVQNANFVEVTAGLFGIRSFNTTATYNFMVAQPDWTSKGEWGVYAGPGAALGYGWYNIDGSFNTLNVTAVAQVGLEYTFWFPLQLSVDLRPQLGFAIGDGIEFYRDGLLYGFIPCLSARYRF